jgi:hypothetical protein
MTQHRLALDDGSLVDVLDRLLDVGAYVDGTVLLTLADVDLVRLDLRLLLASIETLRPDGAPRGPASQGQTAASVPAVRRPTGNVRRQTREPAGQEVPTSAIPTEPTHATPRVRTAPDLPSRHLLTDESDRKDRQAGVAGLVVVVVDIVRQLLERQALRRMDAGQSLMALERQTAELTEFLGTNRPEGRSHR